ncbi:echinoderm microtubule-associated protein-like 1 isoform X2 [Seriola lalandi dorsalis]|uniref:echinoderm microtubule-associated protein-like 1 isoform X2 n=1 Tax=Seriola lalandi dorsalis TaxID=1841481 RepID=UPI000C6FC9B4|nr:echinoderm microtubule-associated protein-like 1 isoform X2 [Seriola lalandi dorsalis]XP_056261779.1 echinoderm microtubule-associated protein-like 1 isoform X1 [Seriola aureovittata]
MEGETADLRGGKGSERVCSREERKRRKTSGASVEGPAAQQRHHDGSSASSVFHDDRSSAASGLDVADRLTYLEQRMQMQEDEIQLLKMALADVLKRLNISEEHQAAAAGRKAPGAKARPVSLALPSRPPMVISSSASLKKSSTLPSSSSARNYSPTPPRSSVKSPPGSVKDSPCKTARSRPTSAASTCKKPQEGSKSKEAAVSVGTRRVTHCKVTMQIYLSPHTRKTGSSETAKSASAVPANSRLAAAPNNPQAKAGSKPETRRTTPTFTLNLQKTTTSQNTPQDTSSYKSPLKSPSQYFQICY